MANWQSETRYINGFFSEINYLREDRELLTEIYGYFFHFNRKNAKKPLSKELLAKLEKRFSSSY